ncbi:hypothetical protein K504DRAFT_146091 [Pleomassaria siparia CBS 279.74]|uniref:Uncharacterized protein n=1 Tax=Pleomassaria siparia CBS 279.74 TaxID=1314801 RepID=A0A6G1KMP3_9PLEO|nr:hypothetical protein K504DRAFT_146091 [Pleomassaria siparia CBS 279.74]
MGLVFLRAIHRERGKTKVIVTNYNQYGVGLGLFSFIVLLISSPRRLHVVAFQATSSQRQATAPNASMPVRYTLDLRISALSFRPSSSGQVQSRHPSLRTHRPSPSDASPLLMMTMFIPHTYTADYSVARKSIKSTDHYPALCNFQIGHNRSNWTRWGAINRKGTHSRYRGISHPSGQSFGHFLDIREVPKCSCLTYKKATWTRPTCP